MKKLKTFLIIIIIIQIISIVILGLQLNKNKNLAKEDLDSIMLEHGKTNRLIHELDLEVLNED